MGKLLKTFAVFILLSFGIITIIYAENKSTYYIPPHLSAEAKKIIMEAHEKQVFKGDQKSFKDAKLFFDTIGPEELKKLKNSGEKFDIKKESIDGISCYWITSPKTTNKKSLLIYTHGGGYILGSASYLVKMPLQIANVSGIKILSIDYRLAPEYKFPAAVSDTLKVYQNILKKGYRPENIGWFGDSAGGGLALASFLAIKDKKIPLPGALALISPWADLTDAGDTFHTLAGNDPFLLAEPNMGRWAKAYAGKHDLKNPLISPVYGNYKGFPPMLIQAGTKEVLLSDAVRVTRKARNANVNVTLDIWEGMWHDFQSVANTPEAVQANREIGLFFKDNLNH